MPVKISQVFNVEPVRFKRSHVSHMRIDRLRRLPGYRDPHVNCGSLYIPFASSCSSLFWHLVSLLGSPLSPITSRLSAFQSSFALALHFRLDSSNPAFTLPGAKLNIMTQSLAYRIIRQEKMKTEAYQEKLNRPATLRNMRLVQEAIADPSNDLPSRTNVWKSTRHKDISRSGRFFL